MCWSRYEQREESTREIEEERTDTERTTEEELDQLDPEVGEGQQLTPAGTGVH